MCVGVPYVLYRHAAAVEYRCGVPAVPGAIG
jgi:hypothetical protein